MSLPFKIAFNTFVSFVGRIISSVFALFVIALIARSLGQDGFGGYTTILAYLSLFVIFADLGLQSLMAREISRPLEAPEGVGRKKETAKIASNFLTLRLVSSLIFLVIGFFASFLFPYPPEVRLGIGVGLFGFFFLSVSQVLLGVFQKHLVMHMQAIAEVAGRGSQLLFVYLIYTASRVYHTGDGLLLFVGAMSGAASLIFILNVFFARRYIRVGLDFDFGYWKNILKTTWPIALSIALTLIYFKIDTVFLSVMKPQADVGIYGIAYKVLESLIFFPAVFAGIMMPLLSKTAVSNMARFRIFFQKSMRAVSIFAFPLAAGGWIFSYSIANIIGGEDFLAAGAPLQALFIATGIIFFGNILGRAVIALDLQKKAVFAYLLGVLFNVVLNLIFIPKYTYMGAAWSTVLTELIVMSFLFYLVWSRLTKSSEEKRVPLVNIANTIKAAFAAVLMGGVLFFFISPITTPLSFLHLGLYTILGAGIYFGALWMVRGISKSEIMLLFKN